MKEIIWEKLREVENEENSLENRIQNSTYSALRRYFPDQDIEVVKEQYQEVIKDAEERIRRAFQEDIDRRKVFLKRILGC